MKFRTELFPEPHNKPISYAKNVVLLGSCFAENIGAKLDYYKFNVCQNPFGILYNPESIAQSLELILENKQFSEDDLFEQEGVFNSFYHHSRFSGTKKDEVIENINGNIDEANQSIKNAGHLLITFGTAWVFELKSTGKVVSNCHKVAADKFIRYRLSPEQISERYHTILKKLWQINPKLQVSFTVSPVRHLKDGATQNHLSKASLLLAIDQLQSTFKQLNYFPAYELLLDDLRDYRFFAEDLTHPSTEAVNYIWEKFKETQIHESSYSAMIAIDKIKKAMLHRPFQLTSPSHQSFVQKQLAKIKQLQLQLPMLNFSEEIKAFENQLT